MKSRRILIGSFAPLVLLLIVAAGLAYAQESQPVAFRAQQAPLGTTFTYQGQLKLDGEPVDGECDMAFRLYDDAGIQVGASITETVVISDGLFTQALDFGADAFTGDARWLGIQVMCPDDAGFTDLGRQALTATPYALYASTAGEADQLGGLPAATFLTKQEFENTDLDNVVTNASFEFFSAGTDTYPDDWHPSGAEDPPNTSVGRADSGYHGAYAVEVGDSTPSIRFCIQQQVYTAGDLPGYFHGQTLVLSAWARKAPVSGVSIGEVAISDGVARSATSLQDDNTWHSVVVTHQVASTATQLIVELCPTGEGTADSSTYQFDAVMLTRGTFEPPFGLGLLDFLASEDVTVDTLSVKGDAHVAGNLAVEGDLQVVGNYIQFPTIDGAAPPSADCDEASEAGRIVVRTDGSTNLYICTGLSGWVGK
jgi:hypothetical protein